MIRVLDYLRHHAIALTALTCSFLALAGASYAAFELPNHSIDPAKLNPRYIGGYVRAWVSVNANGRVTASGGGARVLVDLAIGPGHYIIGWRPRPTSPCEASGSVDLSGIGEQSVPGYLLAEAAGTRGRGEQSFVQTYNAQGQPEALPFDLQLICASPR